MTLKEQLIAAKALIDTPEKLIRPDFGPSNAETSKGRRCSQRHSDAVKFTLTGAIWRAGVDMYTMIKVLPSRQMTLHQASMEMSHADIMALFDRAIEAAE